MHKLFSIVLISFICLNLLHAQTSNSIDIKNFIVKDTIGNIVPFENWTSNVIDNKTHTLKKVNKGDNINYWMVALTENEIIKRDSLLKIKMANSPMPKSTTSFTTNSSFKYLREKDINGNKWNKKTLENKVVVFNFWFINCPPCKKEIPELNKLVSNYATKDSIVFIGIALDDEAALKNFLQTNPFNYHQIADAKLLAYEYGIKSFPTHLIVDKKGIIRFHTSGLAYNTIFWIDKTIQQLLTE